MKKFLMIGWIVVGLLSITINMVFGDFTFSSQAAPSSQVIWPTIGEGVGYLRFEHLTVNDGLSENSVLAILQDSQGFLWFGTQEGLNKYDGYRFITYQADPIEPGGLSDSHITAIVESSDGSLWLGTYYGGVNHFKPQDTEFKHYLPNESDSTSLPDERVNVLLEDSHGILWVGTRAGLSRGEPGEDSFTHYQFDGDDPASISNNDVRSLYEGENGDLWIGTARGLNRYDRNSDIITRILIFEEEGVSSISSISSGGADMLWLGTQGGLVLLNTLSLQYDLYQHEVDNADSLSGNHINSVYQDRMGNLWIGYEDQGVDLVSDVEEGYLNITHLKNREFDPTSLSNNNIRIIYEDRGGVMWFGSQGGGVNKANPRTRAFGLIQYVPNRLNSPAGETITALAFDAARRSLWIGTAESGLDRMSLVTGEFSHYQHDPQDPNSLSSNHVTLLHISPRGDLYVSTEGGTLRAYHADIDGFKPVLSESIGFGRETKTTAIAHDSKGMLWLSRASGELLQIDPVGDLMIRYSLKTQSPEYLQNDLIWDIYVDPSEIIWLATENQGLVRFDPLSETFSILKKDGTSNRPSHNSIVDIHVDQKGLLWLATAGGGVNIYDPDLEEFDFLTTQDGLPSNRIVGIEEDEFGDLWFSTGNGLARYRPATKVIHTYDFRDGLQGNVFNKNAHASGVNGELFFGGMDGINAFYPRMIMANDHIPPVVISEVSLFDRVLLKEISDCSAVLTLTHDENFLSFEFAALDFIAPQNNEYAYMMEGLNEEFVFSGNKRHADYPNLNWGQYTFRIQAANNDGVWNTTGACVNINIKPPFWATWWFISLVGLFLGISVVVGYRWRLYKIESQRQHLVEEVFERTEEIERRRQMALGLSEVIRLLNTDQPLDKSLDFIVKQAVGLTTASKAAIFERAGDLVAARACYPEGETYTLNLNDSQSTSARCLLESTFLNRLLIFSKVDPKTMKSDTRWELVSGNYRTILCTPLNVEDNVYGGLVLYYGEDRTFSPDEINLAHTLADQASLAIANDLLKNKAREAAVMEERNRLARDLHDAVSQTLFSTSLIAEVLPRIWQKDPQQGIQQLQELQQLTRGALGEMRTLLLELRPSSLQDAEPQVLFKHLTDAFTGRTGVIVKSELDISGDCKIPIEVKNAFYRITQEALNNIAKHAEAMHVWFHFSCGSDAVALSIVDDGLGFDPAANRPGHLGLDIMKERAVGIGADLVIISQPGKGTTLRLVWHSEEKAIK